MKIISWNCNGGFRNKINFITELNADIYVIQESESPEKHPKFKEKLNNYLYIGEGHKGLLIFSLNKDIKFTHAKWKDYYRRFFLPVLINDNIVIIGLWACDPYIHEFYFYLRLIENNMKQYSNVILIGDINSNKCFDYKHTREGNHSDTINLLKSWGYESIYHYTRREAQGEEITPTFLMHKNKNKPYHIDFCFAKPKFVKDFQILADDKWLSYSDHKPLVLEII